LDFCLKSAVLVGPHKEMIMNDRYEELRQLLNESRFFKLVCGAGNEDEEEVRRLAIVYTLAGANGFDISATPSVATAGAPTTTTRISTNACA